MKIDISDEIERFKDHLELTGNDQIIFSGIFGIGKTYFLKDFFKENDDYEVFHLYPVNYSISQNNDIINYIKYDIAFQLLGKDIEFEKTDFSTSLTSQFYLKDNYKDIIALFAKYSTPIGKTLYDIFESLKELINNIKKHNSENQIDEKKDVIDFLKELKEIDYSIYEENRITELIHTLINKFEEGKQKVLIIDDLDRLDPEHIFRILNVFACHFDFDNFKENKFGFDKIILVCDIDNIRNIFSSKFGAKTDFTGYIDKFFSREIFYLDNKKIINKSISNFSGKIKISENEAHLTSFAKRGTVANSNLIEILKELVNADLLNLRTLHKLSGIIYTPAQFLFYIDENETRIEAWQYQQVMIFDFLIFLYGSTSSLKSAINKLAKINTSKLIDNRQIKRYQHLITLIDYKNHKNYKTQDKTKNKTFYYENQELDLKIEYKIQKYGAYGDEVTANIDSVSYLKRINNIKREKYDFPFAPFLKIAFDTYLNLDRVE